MISIVINGQSKQFDHPLSIQEILQKMEWISRSVAVAINSEVIPRSEFHQHLIQDEDRVEIIQAVGGG